MSNTVESYEPLRKLRAQLADLEAKRARLAEESQAASAAASAAKAEADEMAVRELMGEATTADVFKATTAAEGARVKAEKKAGALVPYDEAVRRANAMMPKVRAEARGWLVEQLLPEARRRIRKFADALLAASAANEELHSFIENDIRGGELDVTSLGLQYGGLPWPQLRRGDPERNGQGTRLEAWLKEAREHGFLED